ncbi:hypothetical protein ACWV26_16520 [Rummeliibacillus sp. JY-2-4R]
MVKPSYRIRSTYEQRLEKLITISVINIGFNRVMNTVVGEWNGTLGVKVTVKETIQKNTGGQNDNDDLTI